MIDCDEAVKEFLVESYENLDQLDREFVALEAEPNALQRIAAIFRTVHTIKGTSGFLGYARLESLTHAGETLLSHLRDGKFQLNSEMTSALLALSDRVRAFLRGIEDSGVEPDLDCTGLRQSLIGLAQAASANSLAHAPTQSSGAAPYTRPESAPAQESRPPSASEPAIEPMCQSTAAAAPLSAAATLTAELPPAAPPATLQATVTTAPALATASTTRTASDASTAASSGNLSDTNVRVDVALLDRLMNLVGELVLARNQILQVGGKVEDSAFVGAAQRLNLITSELQEGVMKTRMQPIGTVWNKLPRVVRDLSLACGRQVRIEMFGKETELDRTIIEAIKDPMTHIVRNAVDHGIEPPEVRAQAGKPKTGTLTLRAFHEGGHVNIEITDDGSGIDLERVKQKAIGNGLISELQAQRMPDRELLQLVFLPGFSTAQKVTNVSGRGVGMDVVRTNIEKIGGTVDLHSQLGIGTTMRIKIPLTLAIVPALIVTSRGHRFAIPQVNLLELVRLDPATAGPRIEYVHGAPVHRLRGNLLELVELADVLHLPSEGAAAGRPAQIDTRVTNIVVLQTDGRPFGLVVDEIRDTEEIVVKPLGKELKTLSAFAGATIMGDGRVALILDVPGIASLANVTRPAQEHAERNAATATTVSNTIAEKERLLLVSAGTFESLAIPLSMVDRLEEFEVERLERIGARRAVQYRGAILPLIDLAEALGSTPHFTDPQPARVQVVVYSEHSQSVGLVVDRIVDVVEDRVVVGSASEQPGVLGAFVTQQRVTELLDVGTLVRKSQPCLVEEARG
ncbi:MAG: chemotaxis protein CheW [Acidobacteriota bacterium]